MPQKKNVFKEFHQKTSAWLKAIKLSTWFILTIIIYACGTTLMNIWAGKTYGVGNVIPESWGWTTGSMFPITTGGTIISWLVFACMDIVTEIWGKKTAYKVIFSMAVVNVVFSLIGWLVAYIPPSGTIFDNNMSIPGALNLLIGYSGGLTVRMAVASVIAFIIGSYFNTKIFDNMHKKAKKEQSKLSFILRAVVSTVIGQLLDNSIFMILTFAPIHLTMAEKPWAELFTCIGMTTLLECAIEALYDFAFVSHFVNFLKDRKIEEQKAQQTHSFLNAGTFSVTPENTPEDESEKKGKE